MIKRSIAVVIILAVVSLGLITAGQVYWVTQAYQLQEDVFVTKVNSVLINVVNKVHLIENDQSVVEPPKSMGKGSYIIAINHTPSPYLLQTLLEDELQMQGVLEEVEYGVFDCFSNQYEVQGWIDLRVQDDKTTPTGGLKLFPSEGHYLSLYFPQKNIFLFKRIDFWMYSSMVIFVIFVFFAYTIGVLFREKRLSTVRNDFVNNMTHELKTPLATIQLSTEALKADKIFENRERHDTYVSIIESESKRLKAQLEKVLQLSSLTNRKKNLVWQTVDMHELLRTASKAQQIRLEELEGDLEIHLDAANPFVSGDPVHLSNIVYNLLDNAIKYTEQTPHIKVRTRNFKNAILIDIEDNGIGINRRQQRLIFDKFYRVSTGDIHNVKGFGLGLYYVQTMLQAQKGKINVKSEKGRGSVFTLQLPNKKI